MLIKTVMAAALRLDSNYCGCFVATKIVNEEEEGIFCVPHKKGSLTNGGSQRPLFLLRFMNISGDKRNKA